MGKDFNYLCHVSVEKWCKFEYIAMFPTKKITRKVLIQIIILLIPLWLSIYRKVSNIRRTKCQNFNDSRLVLQLSVPNPLKPSVKSITKM